MTHYEVRNFNVYLHGRRYDKSINLNFHLTRQILIKI